MIRSFRDRRTSAVAQGLRVKGFPAELIRVAQRKLFMLDNAVALDDLKSPPGNKLHALANDRKGSTPFGSTISTACVSVGLTAARRTLRSSTITEASLGR